MNTNYTYIHLEPSSQLSEYIHSYFIHRNPANKMEVFTAAPDSFFKIIIIFREGQIIQYFINGLFTKPKEVRFPAKAWGFGCRFKILAPEYLLNQSVAQFIDKGEPLDVDFLNAKHFNFSRLDVLKEQFEKEVLKLKPDKKLHANKLRLSRLLYDSMGTLSVQEVSDQIFWEQKQINRYLKKYLGVPLKTYMNIQRAYSSYFRIKNGDLSADYGSFYDQSHFIKEINKYTGASPKEVFKNKNKDFKQIRNMEKE